MTFLIPLALGVALFVLAPIVAHALRRGQARAVDFPPAVLVPVAKSTAKQRARLEDKGLLAIRMLLILSLALLGASPLMKCSRLSVARPGGASLAVALVLDDSLSMRAVVDGSSHWERAKEGALELLGSTREGDSVSIILAGKPARVALASTTDLGAARRTLENLAPADRSTSVTEAIRLARSTLEGLPHIEKRLVLFSDLGSNESLPTGELHDVSVPLPELRATYDNCGIVEARVRGGEVDVEVSCTSDRAARDRTLIVTGESDDTANQTPPPAPATTAEGEPKASPAKPRPEETTAALRPGVAVQTVRVDLPRGQRLNAALRGPSDAIERDDEAPVIAEGHQLVIAVVADPATASVQTGGGTVLESGLQALDAGAKVEPLSVLPEDVATLHRFAAIIIDDPAGLTPETRAALEKYLRGGGVALVLWGPALREAPLGAGFDPFLSGAPTWQPTAATGVAPDSLAWLGEAGASLDELGADGHVELARATDDGSRILGRWIDGEPFLIERSVGRGLALSAGLSSSVDRSDFALRPAFLALLDHLVGQARSRRQGASGRVGSPWEVASGSEVRGPEGRLQPVRHPDEDRAFLDPPFRGRYEIIHGEATSIRVATLDPNEISSLPSEAPASSTEANEAAAMAPVDVSREIALLVLALSVLELVARAWIKRRTIFRGAAA